jgi:GNAT superfamily N-acetyltransferase
MARPAPPTLLAMTLVDDARELALEAHRGHLRKGSQRAYATHLEDVAGALARCGASDELVAAAWLHDAVEDRELPLAHIGELLGPRVRELVDGVTERERTRPWRERKGATLERIAAADDETVLLKTADALANTRDTARDARAEGPAVWTRFAADRVSQLGWYRAIEALSRARLGTHPLAAELGVSVEELCLAAVRRATPNDVDDVLGLVEHLFTPPGVRPAAYDPEQARERVVWWLGAEDRTLLLDGGGAEARPADAYVAAAVDLESIRFGRRCWVEDLVTREDARRRGHGANLLAAARAWARDRGCTHLELDTGLARHDSQRFYAREGGVRSSYTYGWPLG